MIVAKEKTHHTDNSCDAYQKSEKNKMFIIKNDIYAYRIGRHLPNYSGRYILYNYTNTSQNKLYFNACILHEYCWILNHCTYVKIPILSQVYIIIWIIKVFVTTLQILTLTASLQF